MALRKTELLSALWNALLAVSLKASCWRNLIPCAWSDSASKCAGSRLSLLMDPGSLVCLPSTKTSGAKPPFRLLLAFLAWMHHHTASCRSAYVSTSCSILNLVNMLSKMAPCPSTFPFWKWLLEISWYFWCCESEGNSWTRLHSVQRQHLPKVPQVLPPQKITLSSWLRWHRRKFWRVPPVPYESSWPNQWHGTNERSFHSCLPRWVYLWISYH